MKGGVTRAVFGWLKTRCAAAFWTICRGFSVHAGSPARRPLWVEQHTQIRLDLSNVALCEVT